MKRAILWSLILASVAMCDSGCRGRNRKIIAILTTTGGIQIEISLHKTATIDVIMTSLMYQIKHNEETIMSEPCSFGSATGDDIKLQFEIIESKDHNIIGVIEKSKPEEVLIIFQPAMNYNWPCFQLQDLEWEEYVKLVKLLIARLQKDHPDKNLKIGYEPYFGLENISRASGSASTIDR